MCNEKLVIVTNPIISTTRRKIIQLDQRPRRHLFGPTTSTANATMEPHITIDSATIATKWPTTIVSNSSGKIVWPPILLCFILLARAFSCELLSTNQYQDSIIISGSSRYPEIARPDMFDPKAANATQSHSLLNDDDILIKTTTIQEASTSKSFAFTLSNSLGENPALNLDKTKQEQEQEQYLQSNGNNLLQKRKITTRNDQNHHPITINANINTEIYNDDDEAYSESRRVNVDSSHKQLTTENYNKTSTSTPLINQANTKTQQQQLLLASDAVTLKTTSIMEDTNNSNNNDSVIQFPLYMRMIATMACVIIFTIGVTGNLLVPLVVIKTKDLRNSTNLFLINLSVADVLVLIVCMPTVLVELHSRPETWLLGEPMCKMTNFVEMLAANGSILTILAISFERYYAICKPLKAGYKCTNVRAAIIICLVWCLAILLTSPIIAMAKSPETTYIDGSLVHNCILETKDYWTKTYVFVSMIAFFWLPLIVLMLVYRLIAKRLVVETTGIGPNNNNSSIGQTMYRNIGHHKDQKNHKNHRVSTLNTHHSTDNLHKVNSDHHVNYSDENSRVLATNKQADQIVTSFDQHRIGSNPLFCGKSQRRTYKLFQRFIGKSTTTTTTAYSCNDSTNSCCVDKTLLESLNRFPVSNNPTNHEQQYVNKLDGKNDILALDKVITLDRPMKMMMTSRVDAQENNSDACVNMQINNSTDRIFGNITINKSNQPSSSMTIKTSQADLFETSQSNEVCNWLTKNDKTIMAIKQEPDGNNNTCTDNITVIEKPYEDSDQENKSQRQSQINGYNESHPLLLSFNSEDTIECTFKNGTEDSPKICSFTQFSHDQNVIVLNQNSDYSVNKLLTTGDNDSMVDKQNSTIMKSTNQSVYDTSDRHTTNDLELGRKHGYIMNIEDSEGNRIEPTVVRQETLDYDNYSSIDNDDWTTTNGCGTKQTRLFIKENSELKSKRGVSALLIQKKNNEKIISHTKEVTFGENNTSRFHHSTTPIVHDSNTKREDFVKQPEKKSSQSGTQRHDGILPLNDGIQKPSQSSTECLNKFLRRIAKFNAYKSTTTKEELFNNNSDTVQGLSQINSTKYMSHNDGLEHDVTHINVSSHHSDTKMSPLAYLSNGLMHLKECNSASATKQSKVDNSNSSHDLHQNASYKGASTNKSAHLANFTNSMLYNNSQQMKSRRQVVVMLAFVVTCFFLLFFPYRIFTIWLIFSTEDQVQSLGMETYYNLTYFSRILIYLHSAINPIAYNLISTKFRRAFIAILCCRDVKSRRKFTTEYRASNSTYKSSTNRQCSSSGSQRSHSIVTTTTTANNEIN